MNETSKIVEEIYGKFGNVTEYAVSECAKSAIIECEYCLIYGTIILIVGLIILYLGRTKYKEYIKGDIMVLVSIFLIFLSFLTITSQIHIILQWTYAPFGMFIRTLGKGQ